jgi:hypothetical protein
LISELEPGSWPPNWLQGKPATTRPDLAYFLLSASSSAYWGVKPHWGSMEEGVAEGGEGEEWRTERQVW